MANPLLETQNLSKSYGALQVSNQVTLDLLPNEIHALIGPNGAGKTTALSQLSGQLKPDSGTILYEGKAITKLPMHKRAKLGIARSFQITAIMQGFSVRENVMLAAQAKAKHHFRFFRDARRDATLIAETNRILERLGLMLVAETLAANIAHGQKRQLELAMALATEPKVLLLDEPMAGMGSSETEHMTAVIAELKKDYAILLVEHDMDVVFTLADRISVLVYGKIIASGTPEEIRQNQAVKEAYLGED